MSEYKQKAPACKNCAHVMWRINFDNPDGKKRVYECGNFNCIYGGIPLYPWDICPHYEKRYRRNKQLDLQDMKEELSNG